MGDILLPKNPTPDERAKAAEHGWYYNELGTSWSKYEHGVVTVLNLCAFKRAAIKVNGALDSNDRKVEVMPSYQEIKLVLE